mmetsp:Transcript_47319/g.113652  ORF Transcript_47319/g.113652 Transcript_47319/m.113652 type:complete len:231 (-) Transcript_47319:247-939(-)
MASVLTGSMFWRRLEQQSRENAADRNRSFLKQSTQFRFRLLHSSPHARTTNSVSSFSSPAGALLTEESKSSTRAETAAKKAQENLPNNLVNQLRRARTTVWALSWLKNPFSQIPSTRYETRSTSAASSSGPSSAKSRTTCFTMRSWAQDTCSTPPPPGVSSLVAEAPSQQSILSSSTRTPILAGLQSLQVLAWQKWSTVPSGSSCRYGLFLEWVSLGLLRHWRTPSFLQL